MQVMVGAIAPLLDTVPACLALWIGVIEYSPFFHLDVTRSGGLRYSQLTHRPLLPAPTSSATPPTIAVQAVDVAVAVPGNHVAPGCAASCSAETIAVTKYWLFPSIRALMVPAISSFHIPL